MNPQPVITVMTDTSTRGRGGRVSNHQNGSVCLTQHFLDARQLDLHHTHQGLEGSSTSLWQPCAT